MVPAGRPSPGRDHAPGPGHHPRGRRPGHRVHKWKTPTFAYRGNIASFNPSKHLLSIMFHRGAEIPGEHPRLEGDGKLVRTMRFAGPDELEAGKADLEAAVRAWCDWKAASSTRG